MDRNPYYFFSKCSELKNNKKGVGFMSFGCFIKEIQVILCGQKTQKKSIFQFINRIA